jgi:hypothetical protein
LGAGNLSECINDGWRNHDAYMPFQHRLGQHSPNPFSTVAVKLIACSSSDE